MAEVETETETKLGEAAANGTCPPDDTGEAKTVKEEEAITVKKEKHANGIKEMEEGSNENEKNEVVGVDGDHKLKEEDSKQEIEKEEQELEDVKMEEETEKKEEEESKEVVENAEAKGEEESKEDVETAEEKEENDSKDLIEDAEEEEEEEETVETKESKGEKGHKKRVKEPNVESKEVAKKNKVDEKKAKEISTPMASSLDRPVRERKSVERLVVSIEKGPAKGFHVEKGRGTPLKEIPNVAYKLSRKKTDETFKSLYMILFGRRGKASDVKKNISQFSGFVWHENEEVQEKQRMKLKEKFDKCFKEKLLEFCDVLDISVVKTTTKKEDIVVKLIDFLAAPHATTDVLLAEKEQPSKSRKRKRSVKGTASKSGGASAKRSPGKRRKSGDTLKGQDKRSAHDTEDESEEEEDEENDNGVPDAPQEVLDHSDSEDKEDESVEESEEDTRKRKRGSKKSSPKKESAGKINMKKSTTSRKATPTTPPKKTPSKSSSKHSKVDDRSEKSPRVFSRKKKTEETKKKTSTPAKSAAKEKVGLKAVKGKDKPREEEPGPSEDELRSAICEILKEVDFNTANNSAFILQHLKTMVYDQQSDDSNLFPATFTDILKLLARQFHKDLTSKKSAIKLLIQEELTKLADEGDDNEDDDGEGNEKEDQPTAGQEVEA